MAQGKTVVTVNMRRMRTDLELPTDVPLEVLLPELLNALKNIDPEEFYRSTIIAVTRRGYLLADEKKTLAAYGVRDGEILSIHPVEVYQ